MEESRRFAQTAILRAAHAESQTGDTEQVEIVATYVPELAAENLHTTAPAPGNTPARPARKGKSSAAKGAQR
jgi:hypothetical protein